MTRDDVISICIEANRSLREKYRTFHSDILLEEIISRVNQRIES